MTKPREARAPGRFIRSCQGTYAEVKRTTKTRDGKWLYRLTYRNPDASRWQRIKYWPLHRFIDRMRGDVDVETFRQRLADHAPTVRGLVIVARSIAEFGLTVPQRFTAPLFAVWNFTNRCNLACRHCWVTPSLMRNEGTGGHVPLEKLLGACRAALPLGLRSVKLTGGEPLLYPDFSGLAYGVRRLGLSSARIEESFGQRFGEFR